MALPASSAGADDGEGADDVAAGATGNVEVRASGCDVGSGFRVVGTVGAGLDVMGDRVGDREGAGAGSVCSGAPAERVGVGNVRVGDAVTDGRSAAPP